MKTYKLGMTIKAVLFDLDGTLADSLADLTDAVNHIRGAFSQPQLTHAMVRDNIGKGARHLVRQVLPEAGETEIDHALDLFLQYNRHHIADKTGLYPGIPQLLRELTARGIKMAVISNKNEELSVLILRTLGIHELFECICGGDTYSENKPSPLPLLKVIEKLGLAPHECLMVGDSINDIAAGQLAGVTSIACSWGYGSTEELTGADFLVHAPQELSALFHCREPDKGAPEPAESIMRPEPDLPCHNQRNFSGTS